MSINVNNNLITLRTINSIYQIGVSEYGDLLHLYYGTIVTDPDFKNLFIRRDRGFSGNPYVAKNIRNYSLDTLPLEYPTFGVGDYRDVCLEITDAVGANVCDLKYNTHHIYHGKKKLDGLPSLTATEGQCDTLEISLIDAHINLEVILQYSVFEEYDVITRSSKIINHSKETLHISRALSSCLDLYQPGYYDFISFFGRHAGERRPQREKISHGKYRIESIRGASSLHYNPSGIICDSSATETYGKCYGFAFAYSGNFLFEIEKDQIDQIRIVVGINPNHFEWMLNNGDSFQTPEVIMTYSDQGLEKITHNFHHIMNDHLIKKQYKYFNKPILLNSWEACYFDFDEDKIHKLAEQAKSLNIDLVVLDDGWFGERNDDTTSLGDWFINKKKIRSGLAKMIENINQMGIDFGIWIEPEMISENSNLYKKHPDWMLRYPDRKPTASRSQFVLDLSRSDVVDYLFNTFDSLLSTNNIKYVKWDMNRNISDIFSFSLSANQQGELFHRYILGLYSLLDRLTERHKNVLFETCSGGGGRFDAGMLYYSPQIWCSDNTDPISRINIQLGTSFIYPLSVIGSHVSASPNHQTGRSTDILVRGAVAMTGSFGFELDPSTLSEKDNNAIKELITEYRSHQSLYSYGSFYRLTFNDLDHIAAWMVVSELKDEAIITCVISSPSANAPSRYLYPRGLNNSTLYNVQELHYSSYGDSLKQGGIPLPDLTGDYPVCIIHLKAQQQ